MPVMTTFEIKGDPEELLAVKREKLDPISQKLAPKHGGLAHMVVKMADGIRIYNVWETLEGSEAMARDFQEHASALGVTNRPQNWESWNLEQFVSMKEVMLVG